MRAFSLISIVAVLLILLFLYATHYRVSVQGHGQNDKTYIEKAKTAASEAEEAVKKQQMSNSRSISYDPD